MARKTFAEILSEAVESHGCSLGQIAANLKQRGFKTNRSTLKRWCDGENRPGLKNREVLRCLPDAIGLFSDEKADFLKASSQALGFPLTPNKPGTSKSAVIPQRIHFGADSLPPFAGRRGELTRLQAFVLKNQSVVITGLGGIGKTRLAQELLRTTVGYFAHGCEYLRIIPGQTPQQVIKHVAQLLQMDLDPSAFKDKNRQFVLEQMRTQLQGVRLLFLVDNVEDMEQVRDLVRQVPAITWVFTTRDIAQKSRGVRAIPLKMPSRAEAVEIFQAHIKDAPISDLNNLPLLQEAMQKLGHLPLALRLVAGRLRNGSVTTVADLNEWLARGGLRKGRSFSIEPQELFEQTLESIPTEAREIFEICGAFVSPKIQLVHLQPITYNVGIKLSLDALELLADYSLVDSPDEEHIELHPLLHDYARSRLKASSKYSLVWDQFKEYYLEVAESISKNKDATQRVFRPLIAEEQNILRVAEAFYHTQDWIRLKRIWPAVTAYLWSTGNRSAYEIFDHKCLEAAQATKDSYWEAVILSELGYVKLEEEAWAEAEELFQRSQAIHDASSDQVLEQARLRRYRAAVASGCDELDTAVQLLSEAETLLSQLTNPPETRLDLAWKLLHSAKMTVFHQRGELEKAEAAGQMANHLYQRLSPKEGGQRMSGFKVELGDLLFRQGKMEDAEQLWEETVLLQGGPLPLPDLAEAQMRLSWLNAKRGAFELATQMALSAQQVFKRYGQVKRCTQIDELLSSMETRADLPLFTDLFEW